MTTAVAVSVSAAIDGNVPLSDLPVVKSWADFGHLFAKRMDAHQTERSWLVKAAHQMGLDLDGKPQDVPQDVRDAICEGILLHYIESEPSRKYRRGEDRKLTLVTDGTTYDVELTARTACVPASAIKTMKKSDPALHAEYTAMRVRLDTRKRVRYFSLFAVNKEAKREAAINAKYSPDGEERDEAAGKAKAAKAAKAEAKPMTLETIAGMCEAMFTGLQAAQKAGKLPKAKVTEVGKAVAALRKATGIAAK